MIRSTAAARRRRLSFALGTSALAWGLVLPSAAQAQCAPDPTTANGTTTCTGTDANGVRVTTRYTTLVVASGAAVSNSGSPAIAVDVPRASSAPYSTNTLMVLGTVSAPGQTAIAVNSGTLNPSSYYSTQQTALAVGAGGSVTGATALALFTSSGNPNGTVSVSVDNAGTVTGTDGTALLANTVSTAQGYPSLLTSFSTITNRAGASIVGGIIGQLSTLANAGSIDGGGGSALDSTIGYAPTVTNATGAAIRSTSAAATILAGRNYYMTVTNAGTIANAGSGAALSGGLLTVTNQAGGQITSAGATTIAASTSLTLTNRGTVTGNVTAGDGGSTIDSTGGTINGSVTLGNGNDTLIARYVGTRALATGITGAIDAGGGTNTERVVFATDTLVTTPIDLNAGFGRLLLAPDAKVTATLTAGFSTATPLVITGLGTVINQATIALPTRAVSDLDYAFDTSAQFRNEGSITALLSGNTGLAGVVLSSHSFANSGSVTVTGGTGVSVSYNPVINSGIITASGTGLNLFDGVLTNSGTINSTGGVGVNLYGNVGYTGSNSGTISGATIGAITSIYLTNTGTISSAGTGVNVQGYGYLINAAGGVVNGGSGGAISVGPFNAGVANAGTINGNVSFGGAFSGDNSLSYIAQTGGVLNGNLSLGNGATLVTDLVNTGPGQFAGITGTVTAGSSSALRYAFTADASATLPTGNVGPFANVGYQLANGAALTLTAPAGQARAQPLQLAGNGSVDLDAVIATSNAPAVQSTYAITYPRATTTTGALSITSRGAIAVTRTNTNGAYYGGAVTLLAGDSFTNAGSIVVNDQTTYATAAIYGGAKVANAGTITLNGATGISSAAVVSNTGLITQASGSRVSSGVTSFGSLTNSGTISVAGSAAQFGYFYSSDFSGPRTLVNSGTLVSTGGAAITTNSAGYLLQVTNQAGGTITGLASAIQLQSATLNNAGTITGAVDLGYAGPNSRSYGSSSYVAAGGTIAGDLLFGTGDDLLLQIGDALGVSGIVDGGAGTDIYGRSIASSGTVVIDFAGIRNFEGSLIQAVGTNTAVTATATGTFQGNLYVAGTGSIVNQANIAGMLTTSLPYPLSSPYLADPIFPSDPVLASLTNAGAVAGGVYATVPSFTNSGTVTTSSFYGPAVSLSGAPTLAFVNSGTIGVPSTATYYTQAASLYATQGMTIDNSGRIDGGLSTTLLSDGAEGPASFGVANSGTITSSNGYIAADVAIGVRENGGTASIANSGTISAESQGSAYALDFNIFSSSRSFAYVLTNTGTISAAAAPVTGGSYPSYAYGLIVQGANLSGTITNAAGGTLSATGDRAYAILAADSPLSLINAGTIRAIGTAASNAVTTFDAFDNSIRNTGTITGNIRLAAGVDSIDNAGTITGAVSLGAGDDRFVQQVGGTVTGLVDGGDGTDGYDLITTGSTVSLAAAQITNFERVTQTGAGIGVFSGSFGVDTIGLAGGTLSVAAGQTLATQGATTLTGSAGSGPLALVNAGTIAGGVTLADGNDIVTNTGAIGGAVLLGAGDDIFVEGVGSSVAGGVDGVAGANLYRVVLGGDRAGIGARANFQTLAVDGTGTLALTLDQSFQSIALTGTSLSLGLGGYTVGQITATGPATQATLDGDVGAVGLGAGNDTLAIGAVTLAGRYDGGAGTDALRLTSTGAVTLAGTATGFDTLALTGNALTIAGMLGSTGQRIAITGGDKTVTVARDGVLAGTIDLGAGNDGFQLAAGGTLAGTVSGGAGSNAATLDLSAGDFALRAGTLTNFARLTTEGAGTLTLGGGFAYDTLAAAGNLTVAADASLAAGVAFGSADNRFTIAGGFAGAVDGGAGTDSIDVSGGSATAPVAFSIIANVEAYRMSGGLATIAGTASLGNVMLTSGRLVGLAGSSMIAAAYIVGQGATFGSAGTVTGNVSVVGTLSPGASPGTMTVNGTVALAATSTSLFEITPTVSDQLVVNGALTIAGGATLQLVSTGTLTPGQSLDLITTSGGITGSFTTVIKPASLFGFVVQDANTIRLLGQFLNDVGYTGQVRNSIDYVNGVLTSGQASAALIAAAPLLVGASGGANAAAFARLTPEPYATARQIGVENGLTLADAARGGAFAPTRDAPGVYTFASALSGTRTLRADVARETARTTVNGYGFLAGIGVAGEGWSLGAFGGWLNGHQNLSGLGARTQADGGVAGVQGRLQQGAVGLKAMVAYDGAQADTRRALPGGSAFGRYDLHSWTADASIDAIVPLTGAWTVRPSIGGTAIRTTRDGVAETGGGAFALIAAKQRSTAAFVDGSMTFASAVSPGGITAFRPYLTIGARYQVEGRTPYALAALGGGDLGLLATGAARAPVLATAMLGADVAVSEHLAVFGALSGESGDADHRASGRAGIRLAF
ncbi:autotransporter outer membrane beta-barrel domain-containing protein [Sphingomonas qilianensis]|uniref:Autotransporter outer membrane beta-barrel domain-containing protein n=1 Tax=Sphingomonas qilianensis TaxID=1736690 RepID=A0ABU9XU21_9SPHN